MRLYIVSNKTNRVVAEITGETNAECEARAAQEWGTNDYNWTYTPAFGSEGGALPPNPTLERLLLLLKQGGYSQRGAAKELEVSDRMMRYYCSGKQPIPRVVMLALEHLVNCPPHPGAESAALPDTK